MWSGSEDPISPAMMPTRKLHTAKRGMTLRVDLMILLAGQLTRMVMNVCLGRLDNGPADAMKYEIPTTNEHAMRYHCKGNGIVAVMGIA